MRAPDHLDRLTRRIRLLTAVASLGYTGTKLLLLVLPLLHGWH